MVAGVWKAHITWWLLISPNTFCCPTLVSKGRYTSFCSDISAKRLGSPSGGKRGSLCAYPKGSPSFQKRVEAIINWGPWAYFNGNVFNVALCLRDAPHKKVHVWCYKPGDKPLIGECRVLWWNLLLLFCWMVMLSNCLLNIGVYNKDMLYPLPKDQRAFLLQWSAVSEETCMLWDKPSLCCDYVLL